MINWFLLQGSWKLMSNIIVIIASQKLFSRSTIFFSFLVLFCFLLRQLHNAWCTSPLVGCVYSYTLQRGICYETLRTWKKILHISSMDSLLLEQFSLICNFSDCSICNAHPFPISILILEIPSALKCVHSCNEEGSNFLSAPDPVPVIWTPSIEQCLEKTLMAYDRLHL